MAWGRCDTRKPLPAYSDPDLRVRRLRVGQHWRTLAHVSHALPTFLALVLARSEQVEM